MDDPTFQIENGRLGILSVLQRLHGLQHIYPPQVDIFYNTMNLKNCRVFRP
ncbi:hypothetical protein HanRHA438_Chr09g0423641 [Helianthus annuus]|nr:hypothetical protein HanRHA438_Chr09g0423641 [Helianthus annuus]